MDVRRGARYLLAAVLALSAVALAPAVEARAEAPDRRIVHEVVPGLTLIRLTWNDGPVRAFVLRVDLSRNLTPDVATGDAAYPAFSSSVVEIAAREDALAAVNGDFGSYRPLGPFVRDGRLVQTGVLPERVIAFSGDRSKAVLGRPRLHAFAVADGVHVAIGAWNSGGPDAGGIAASTAVGGLLEAPPPRTCTARLERVTKDRWSQDRTGLEARYRVARVTCAGSAPASGKDVVLAASRHSTGARFLRSLARGDPVRLGWRGRWAGVTDLQGGRPLLLDHGDVVVPSPCRGNLCGLHPRTGVGVSAGCEDESSETRCVLFYVVVDGRQPGWSLGMTLPAFARLMHRAGASSALNLDGGGSSTMVVEGEVVNRPSLGVDRSVPAAFLVLRGAIPDEPAFGDEVASAGEPTMSRWLMLLARSVIERWM